MTASVGSRPALSSARAGDTVLWWQLGAGTVIFSLLTALLLTGHLSDLDVPVRSAVSSSSAALHLGATAESLVVLGQRFVITPFLLTAAFLVSYWEASLRPLRLALFGFFVHNALVGSVKILTGRPSPLSGADGLFDGGMLYPSGHAANSVVLWGLTFYLLVQAGVFRPRLAVSVVVTLSFVVSASSLLLSTHWLGDLVAGVAAGAALLAATVLMDRVGCFSLPLLAPLRLPRVSSR